MVLKLIKYTNAAIIKLRNKRVSIHTVSPNQFLFTSLQLSKDFTPRCVHNVYKGKVVETRSFLTYKGAVALYAALEKQLAEINFKEGNVETTKLGNQTGDFGFENHHCEYFKYSDHILVLNCDDTLTRVDREDIRNWHEL